MRVSRLPQSLLCFAIFLLPFFISSAHAENLDLVRLMQLLSVTPAAEVPYTEKKYSSLLTEPVVSSGTLAFRRPDTIEKTMKRPRNEHYLITGEELVVTRGSTERRFPLSSQPLLSAFAASLRGVLTGDVKLLREHYQLALEGEERNWRLELLPLEAGISRYVEQILVTGQADRIKQIEVRESNGDRSVMLVQGSAQ